MRIIPSSLIYEKVKEATKKANFVIEEDISKCLKKGCLNETNPLSKKVLEEMVDNIQIANDKHIPICQDTGIVVIFMEIGEDVFIEGSMINDINKAVKEAYLEEYLRCSVLNHPIERKNTFTNTPCIIHEKHVPGDKLKITICPKGAGSENMSQLKMLPPSAKEKGIIDFVLDVVKNAGGKACPPMIVGVGIGGNFEQSAIYSKEALLRPINDESDDIYANKLEKILLEKINQLNVGPMGFGGQMSAMAVKVKCGPCHIASLPVAVNIQCHVARHEEVIL